MSDSTEEAKKAPRKRATKKATAVVEAPAAQVTADEAPKKVARKRATKKVVAEAPAVEISAEPAAAKKRAVRKKAVAKEDVVIAVVHETVATQAAPRSEPVSTPAPQAPQSSQPQRQAQQNQNHQNQQNGQNPFKKKKKKKKNKWGQNEHGQQPAQHQHQQQNQPHKKFKQYPESKKDDPDKERPSHMCSGPRVEATGLLEIAPRGNGYLCLPNKNYNQNSTNVYVPLAMVSRYSLRVGSWIEAEAQLGPRGYQVVELKKVNGVEPDEARKLPHFEELKAVNPSKRLPFETVSTRHTTRVLDILAPVGKGQRGLIVSPPRSGKTTLLLHIAESLKQKEDENMHLMIVLIDERPEEVTEFRRALPGVEIIASSNDEHPKHHCRIAELAIERAKRLVEAGKDVFILLDSITRLARAYNNDTKGFGRGVGSGGITVGALEKPRRLFAAARNTRGAGSLTILATALIQTNSRADEAIFQEFKGTGNMELVLDRKIAESYIFPAVDIFKSGTRREELLLPEHMLDKIYKIRRGLSGHRPLEAMERLNYFLKKFPSNAQMLLEIKG